MHVYYLTVRCVIDFIDGEGDGGLADRGGQGLNLSQFITNQIKYLRRVQQSSCSRALVKICVAGKGDFGERELASTRTAEDTSSHCLLYVENLIN